MNNDSSRPSILDTVESPLESSGKWLVISGGIALIAAFAGLINAHNGDYVYLEILAILVGLAYFQLCLGSTWSRWLIAPIQIGMGGAGFFPLIKNPSYLLSYRTLIVVPTISVLIVIGMALFVSDAVRRFIFRQQQRELRIARILVRGAWLIVLFLVLLATWNDIRRLNFG